MISWWVYAFVSYDWLCNLCVIKELRRKEMKAWLVRNEIDACATVVFAETRGKARALALHTDTCEDLDFCEISVTRLPKADKYYKEGKWELDWFNQKERVIFVKELGFNCNDVDLYVCEGCSAKEYCDAYKDEKAWENEEDE